MSLGRATAGTARWFQLLLVLQARDRDQALRYTPLACLNLSGACAFVVSVLYRDVSLAAVARSAINWRFYVVVAIEEDALQPDFQTYMSYLPVQNLAPPWC